MAVCVAGCDQKDAGSDRARLIVAITPGALERPIYRAAFDRFRAGHPDIAVEVIEVPGNYYQKILVMIAGGNSPDLMWMGQGVGEFADRGTLLDISDRIAGTPGITEIPPAALNTYRFRGKQYGVPFGIDTQFIVYNRELFRRASLPFPSRDWDFKQFMDAAQKLTIDRDGDGRPEQFGFCGELDASLFKACFIEPESGKPTCNTPEMLKYLHTNLDLYHRHKVAVRGKEAGEGTLDDNLTLFRQGRVAMMLMMTWDLPFIRERLSDMDWDVTGNPRVDRQAQWGSTQAMVISSRTRYPDQAWQLCQEFLGEEFQSQMAPYVIPSNQRIASGILHEQRQPPSADALLSAARNISVDPRVPHLSELIKYWYDARESVWCGQSTPEEAMSRADAQIHRASREFEGANQ
jgi:multiple sugar transport system substrate-binding protein